MGIRITDTIELIVGTNPQFPGLKCCNTLYINDDIQTLIDTGAGQQLQERIQTGELANIDRIVHTHLHPDHTNYDHLFPDAELWVPEAEAYVMEDWENFFRFNDTIRFGYEEAKKFATRLGYRPRKVDGTVADGDKISFGKTVLQAIYAPGHSVGHTLFWHEESGMLLGADIDLSRFGPWYGNPGSDIDETIRSIEKVMEIKPKIYISCHLQEVVTEGLNERLIAYMDMINQRDELLIEQIGSGIRLDDLVDQKPFYRRHPEPVAISRMFEQIMIEKHLERLQKSGRIDRQEDIYFTT
ncbi:MBL fold metallo-hydrolase [Effusibacillus dendaii]|uniref:MBL fold hydrolase n=1 Tax=Effusibacillus dendaii TaxID=2743772 RepID=A0A7I8DE94_9BACL|nr:MBL fold metallo-hydrolase [Effusibacillus dendaii]BCJ86850.1 MBL fold hydrolase [Effusibacillus dendaii]